MTSPPLLLSRAQLFSRSLASLSGLSSLGWLIGATALCLNLSLSSALLAQEIFLTPSAPSPAASAQETPKEDLKTAPHRALAPPYQTMPLALSYRGEEARGVRYFQASSQARARSLVKARDGRLIFAHNERLLNEMTPTPTPRPSASPNPSPEPSQARALGYAIYVMDAQGRFYVSFEAQRDVIHHSSLLAGAPVACAGELLVFEGRLALINNRSGHYRPPPRALEQALHALKEAGVELQGVKVERFGVDF